MEWRPWSKNKKSATDDHRTKNIYAIPSCSGVRGATLKLNLVLSRTTSAYLRGCCCRIAGCAVVVVDDNGLALLHYQVKLYYQLISNDDTQPGKQQQPELTTLPAAADLSQWIGIEHMSEFIVMQTDHSCTTHIHIESAKREKKWNHQNRVCSCPIIQRCTAACCTAVRGRTLNLGEWPHMGIMTRWRRWR